MPKKKMFPQKYPPPNKKCQNRRKQCQKKNKKGKNKNKKCPKSGNQEKSVESTTKQCDQN